jgi:hypothetical protein
MRGEVNGYSEKIYEMKKPRNFHRGAFSRKTTLQQPSYDDASLEQLKKLLPSYDDALEQPSLLLPSYDDALEQPSLLLPSYDALEQPSLLLPSYDALEQPSLLLPSYDASLVLLF